MNRNRFRRSFHLNTFFSLPLLGLIGLFPHSASASGVSSVSRFGVTWSFDRDVEAGRFANGDWWVVGPVVITEITPKSVDGMHGSIINPEMGAPQGFDRRMQRTPYVPEANVALRLPLEIKEPASLLSSISLIDDTTRDHPQLDTIAILTVLLKAPPEGSFRPPYQGTDKTIPGNVADLNFDILRDLKRVEGSPEDLKELATRFERPYIEIKLNWTGRYWHPKSNQRGYGRDMAHQLGLALLALQLDEPDEVKKPLLVNLVQIGIDIYGAARLGGAWNADGGHNQGRKMPLILAGLALGNEEILQYADAGKHLIFQEDQQTFYVSQDDVDRGESYSTGMIGTPEWGIRHSYKPETSNSSWRAKYRTVSGAPTITHVLVARLMGVEKLWNHAAIFDYYDRYWEVETNPETRLGEGVNGIQDFTLNMWKAYR